MSDRTTRSPCERRESAVLSQGKRLTVNCPSVTATRAPLDGLPLKLPVKKFRDSTSAKANL